MENNSKIGTLAKVSGIIANVNAIIYFALAVAVVVAVIFAVLFFADVRNRFTLESPAPRGGVYFHHALVTELSEARRLVTLDIELEQSIAVDNESRWGVLRIAQEMTFYATGTFSVNLARLSPNDVIIDDRRERIFVRIPRPTIEAITIDPDRTVFMDPERGLLRFGDVTMSPEAHNTIQAEIVENMRRIMLVDHMNDAEQYTKQSVSALLGAILDGMGLEDYAFDITWE